MPRKGYRQTTEHRARISASQRGLLPPLRYSEAQFEACFWDKVLDPDPKTGCMVFGGGLDSNGYGVVSRNRKFRKAHIVSAELNFGPVPSGLEVCHHCDTPPCVNPYHLFIGTHSDNMLDMLMKKQGMPSIFSEQRSDVTAESDVNTVSQASRPELHLVE